MAFQHQKFSPVFSSLLVSRSSSLAVSGVVAIQVGLTHFGLLGWECPFLQLTGIPCPGCGLSRAMVALLRGDWQGSLKLHAFAPIFLLGLILVVLFSILPETYRQGFVHRLESIETRSGISLVFLISLILYWVARLVVAPAEFIWLINNFSV